MIRNPPALFRLLLAVLLSTALPAHAEWDALTALEHSGAVVSASAMDLDTGAVIGELNADTRLTPASLTKLTVAAAALEVWPADKTFQTRILATGPFHDGQIDGDIYLQGTGDSTLDHLALWSLAAQLKGGGVTAVSGRLIVDTAPFGPLGCETEDRCNALQKSDTAYNAPLSAVAVDYGNWCVEVRPTRPGEPAVVTLCGAAQSPIPVDGTVKTVSVGGRPTFWVERVTDNGADSLRVGGEIAPGSGVELYRSMSDPALGVGQVLGEILREIGIRVTGPIEVRHAGVPANAYMLAENEGLSLKEQLGRMLRFSNNYVADMLTLNMGAALMPKAPTQLADAARVLSDFVADINVDGKRGKRTAPPLFSGSGLTPENLISADDLVALLDSEYHNPRNFPAFYGGLVVPRQAPFLFLRQGDAQWLDRVALKTGTMDDPHSVCGIAGYIRKRSGGWIAFAAIVNGGPHERHVPLWKAMEAARKDVDSLLAHY